MNRTRDSFSTGTSRDCRWSRPPAAALLIALAIAASGCDESDGGGTTATKDLEESSPITGLHDECSDQTCPTGLTPVKFYGVAGTQGPEFCRCEIPCAEAEPKCPTNMGCVYVADGPGAVCAWINPSGKADYLQGPPS